MSGSGSVRSCVAVASLLVLLLLSHIEISAAKSLSLQGDYWPTERGSSKKNSWWSKKSVESSSDYNRLLKDPSRESLTMEDQTSTDIDFGSDSILELYGCYITNCVPEFVRCAERSRSHSSNLSSQLGLGDMRSGGLTFSQCRRNHQLCAEDCRV